MSGSSDYASQIPVSANRLTWCAVPKGPDLSQAQASVQAASSRAGAYLSSWGSWAAEKHKIGWGRAFSGAAPSAVGQPASAGESRVENERPIPVGEARRPVEEKK